MICETRPIDHVQLHHLSTSRALYPCKARLFAASFVGSLERWTRGLCSRASWSSVWRVEVWSTVIKSVHDRQLVGWCFVDEKAGFVRAVHFSDLIYTLRRCSGPMIREPRSRHTKVAKVSTFQTSDIICDRATNRRPPSSPLARLYYIKETWVCWGIHSPPFSSRTSCKSQKTTSFCLLFLIYLQMLCCVPPIRFSVESHPTLLSPSREKHYFKTRPQPIVNSIFVYISFHNVSMQFEFNMISKE